MVFGDVIKSWSAPSFITGIVFDGQYLWLSRLFGNEVYCYTRDGVQIKKAFTASWMEPDTLDGMGFDGQYLWLLYARNLHCVTRDGVLIKTITLPRSGGAGLIFDGPFLWYSLCYGELGFSLLHCCSRDGVRIKSFLTFVDVMPGLAFDRQYFYMCEFATDTLYLMTKEAIVLKTAPTPSTYPWALCFDGQYLWHSDLNSNLIYMLSRV